MCLVWSYGRDEICERQAERGKCEALCIATRKTREMEHQSPYRVYRLLKRKTTDPKLRNMLRPQQDAMSKNFSFQSFIQAVFMQVA